MRGVFAAQDLACKRTVAVVAWMAVAVWLVPRACGARTLEVGPSREFANPALAAAAGKDGGRVVFDPGVYRSCAIWPASHLILEARRPPNTMSRTVMTQTIVTGATCGDRALFTFIGNDIAVRGISFQHARDSEHTGAGILMEGDNLLVEDASFIDNENGILAGGSPDSIVRVQRVLFRGNGSCLGSCAHALYAGARIARLEVLGCV